MRIISGKFRGKKLNSPEGIKIRPTTERLRESIFDALSHRIGGSFEGLRVADVFAGTGAMGLEALSRGAKEVVFVEKSPEAVKILRQNFRALETPENVEILPIDSRNLSPAQNVFDVVFMDPPYGEGLIEPTLESLLDAGWVDRYSFVTVECAKTEDPEFPREFEILKTFKQGKRKTYLLRGTGKSS